MEGSNKCEEVCDIGITLLNEKKDATVDDNFTFIKRGNDLEKLNQKSIDVLFGFTSLSQDSTLMENYDFIQYKLNDIFENWSEISKNTHFVYKNAKQEILDDRYGLETIQGDKYNFQDTIHNQHLVAYMNSCDVKFDVVFLTECPNLIDLFYDSKTIRSLFDEDIRMMYKRIKDFYNGLKPDGMLVNLYYNEIDDTTSFANIELFYDYSCIWSLDVYLFLLRLMGRLFKKVEPGFYQKEAIEDIDGLIETTYQEIVEELFDLGVEKLENKDELIDAIDKKYFSDHLRKSNKFEVERPLLSSISKLVKNALKATE